MESIFDLQRSFDRARQRLALTRIEGRKRRSDRGQFRLDEDVANHLRGLLSGDDYPGFKAIFRDLRQFCAKNKRVCPSRATVYKFMQRDPGRSYLRTSLPPQVSEALYNLAPGAIIPGAQLAFYCFNYGSLAAIHFAAGLPWLALHQAVQLRGWRPQSYGLLKAVLYTRKITRA